MAFTPAEEARLRALMNQDTSLLTLATNEPAIIQELGAQDVTIDELQLASSLLQTDKVLGRFGGEDKAVVLSALRSFMNNGMAALSDLTALLPKRSFSSNDFIRIPDEPGGLIFQWGSASIAGSLVNVDVPLPASFPNSELAAVATQIMNPVNVYYGCQLVDNSAIRFKQSGVYPLQLRWLAVGY